MTVTLWQHDPLAQWRRSSRPPTDTPPTGPEQYLAFDTKDKVFCLRIRGADDFIYAPRYNILLNVLYDKQGTHFILTYTVMLVLARGKNLQKVVFAIENGMADYIQEFDFKRAMGLADGTRIGFIRTSGMRCRGRQPQPFCHGRA